MARAEFRMTASSARVQAELVRTKKAEEQLLPYYVQIAQAAALGEDSVKVLLQGSELSNTKPLETALEEDGYTFEFRGLTSNPAEDEGAETPCIIITWK